MNNMIRATAIAVFASAAALAAAPAMSDTVLYASAGYVPNGENGDYFLDSSGQQLVAATFTLTQASQITGVGGVFTQFDGDGGSIFASIIAAPAAQIDVSLSTLPGLSLAHTVFAPPADGSDASTPISLLLGREPTKWCLVQTFSAPPAKADWRVE